MEYQQKDLIMIYNREKKLLKKLILEWVCCGGFIVGFTFSVGMVCRDNNYYSNLCVGIVS